MVDKVTGVIPRVVALAGVRQLAFIMKVNDDGEVVLGAVGARGRQEVCLALSVSDGIKLEGDPHYLQRSNGALCIAAPSCTKHDNPTIEAATPRFPDIGASTDSLTGTARVTSIPSQTADATRA